MLTGAQMDFLAVVDIFDHLIHGLIGAEQNLVTDQHPNDVAMVFPVNLDQFGDLFLVRFGVTGDPGAENDIKATCCSKPGNLGQGIFNGVGPDRMDIAS